MITTRHGFMNSSGAGWLRLSAAAARPQLIRSKVMDSMLEKSNSLLLTTGMGAGGTNSSIVRQCQILRQGNEPISRASDLSTATSAGLEASFPKSHCGWLR
jgi:hypothetical protein